MSRATISTHVLDVSLGKPAAGISVTLTLHRTSLSALAGELPQQSPPPLAGEPPKQSPSLIEGERAEESPSPLEGEGEGGGFRQRHVTDRDGRIPDLTGGGIEPGSYQVVFDLGPYFGDRPHLFNKVSFEIVVTEARHYHVPLLISPYSCSSYRGS